jgi:type IV secretory pathway VirB3-like protein
MDIDISTPALLFPAISLLMLAYTNRFLGLAAVIRSLHAEYLQSPDTKYVRQIQNLRRRIMLIRNMQFWGGLSILFCTICMFVLFEGLRRLGTIFFGISIITMTISLVISLWEVQLSVGALKLHLKDIEESAEEKAFKVF